MVNMFFASSKIDFSILSYKTPTHNMSHDKLDRVFNTEGLREFRTRLENAAHLCRADNQELALSVLNRGMRTRGQDPSLSNEANIAGLHLAQMNDLFNEGVTGK